MVEHYWGDPEYDWKSLYEATSWFPTQAQRWGRMCVHAKEKWGCLRLEYFYWGATLFQLVYPGRLVTEPRWLYDFSYNYARPVLKYSGIGYLIEQYQRLVFNILTIRMVKKWPHLKEELTEDFEFQELLYKRVKKWLDFKDKWVKYNPNA